MNVVPESDESKNTWRAAFALLRQSTISRWAAIPLRLMVGFGFLQHGIAKLQRGPDAFATILQSLSVPAPHFMASLTIVTEIFGGLAVLLGALVILVSIPMTAVLLVAMFTVQLPYGFSSVKLACLAALVLLGSGPLAIDGFAARWRRGRR